jgi:hypothetical protein
LWLLTHTACGRSYKRLKLGMRVLPLLLLLLLLCVAHSKHQTTSVGGAAGAAALHSCGVRVEGCHLPISTSSTIQ